MIKNSGATARVMAYLALLALPGCQAAQANEAASESYQGVAELDERALAFEVSGRVTSILRREGDRVAPNQILATVDDALDAQARAARDLEARAAAAQSSLVDKGVRPEEIAATRARIRAARSSEELLKKQVERERGLFARGVTPEAQLDEITNQLARAVAEREALESVLSEQVRGARPEEREVAKAKADAARASVTLDDLRIQRRELRAPADGVVLDVLAEPGEVVAAGAPVFNVADPSRIYAYVFVPQAKLSGIDVGDRASVRADGLTAPLGGKVEHVSRRTEFTPRYLFSERERPNLVVRVKVRIDDPKQLLHAGVPVFVQIDRTSGSALPAATASAE
jgi:HlyD family secretion protein